MAVAINQTAAPSPLNQHLPSSARMDAIPAGKADQQSLSRPSQAEETLPQQHFQDSITKEATPPIQTIQSSVQSRSMRPQALQPSVRPVSAAIILNKKSTLQRTPDHTSGQQRHLASTVPVLRGEDVAQSGYTQKPSRISLPKQSSTQKPGSAEDLALTAQPKPSKQSSPTIHDQNGSVHEIEQASTRVQDVEANPTEQTSHGSPQQSLHTPIQANHVVDGD
jgi:hypothetical protein